MCNIHLEKVLEAKIISCVAGVWTSKDKYCLPVDIAAEVIRATGTRALVLHITENNESISNEIISFEELISELSIPLSEMILLFNTSGCSSLKTVQRVIEKMEYICSGYPSENKDLLPSFLKLEILDNDLRPNDKATLKIIKELDSEIRKICIPFLKGNEETIKQVSRLGCPAARIWCSDIGKGAGITDLSRLQLLLNSTDIPLILEGGLATPQHVQQALALGFRAVLINSAFRFSKNPIELAKKIRAAIDNLSTGQKL